jgi:hypothetical protein
MVVEKMVIGPLHRATVKRINRLLTTTLLDLAIVSVQDPIVLADSEPGRHPASTSDAVMRSPWHVG